MLLKFLSMVMIILLFGGCTSFNDPDFDKPLIVLPEDKPSNPENKETKPLQQRLWVEAKTSRIWVNPHIDENGDYVEGYYKYIVLDPGHWILNGNQTRQQ